LDFVPSQQQGQALQLETKFQAYPGNIVGLPSLEDLKI